MNNLALVTYTHSNCRDVWPSYFTRLNHFLNEIDSFVFNDKPFEEYSRHKFLTYDDVSPYYLEYTKCLNQFDHKYVIYMQEDFILYLRPNLELLNRYLNILEKDHSISYIRLLRCGDVTSQQYEDNLFYISKDGRSNQSINSYSMQPTIWRKADLIKLYETAARPKFGEYIEYAHAMNKLNINGLYHYSNEKSRGGHFDSSVFPYIATAIVKKKWNVSEYPDELKSVFREFKINPNLRGFT